MTDLIGQPVRRTEDQRLLTGKGRFIDDLNLPNQCIRFSCGRSTRMRASPRSSCARGGCAGRARNSHRPRLCRRWARRPQSHAQQCRPSRHVETGLRSRDLAARAFAAADAAGRRSRAPCRRGGRDGHCRERGGGARCGGDDRDKLRTAACGRGRARRAGAGRSGAVGRMAGNASSRRRTAIERQPTRRSRALIASCASPRAISVSVPCHSSRARPWAPGMRKRTATRSIRRARACIATRTGWLRPCACRPRRCGS